MLRLFFFFPRDRVSLCSPGCPGTHCRPGWPRTQKSSCLCLPSARIKGVRHHCPAAGLLFLSITLNPSILPFSFPFVLQPTATTTILNLLHQLGYPKHFHRQLDSSHCLSHASLICQMFLFSLTTSSVVGQISHVLLTAGLSFDPNLIFQSFSYFPVLSGYSLQ